MQHYEMLVLVPNTYTEDEYQKILLAVKKDIAEQGGAVDYEEDFGRRRMAYPIKSFHHGYYHILEFDLDPLLLKVLNEKMTLLNEVIRHQIIKKKKLTEEERKKEKQRKERLIQQQEEEADQKQAGQREKEDERKKPISGKVEEKGHAPKTEEAKAEKLDDKKEEKSEKNQGKIKQIEDDKIKLEDLDKKLDEILDSDNLL